LGRRGAAGDLEPANPQLSDVGPLVLKLVALLSTVQPLDRNPAPL